MKWIELKNAALSAEGMGTDMTLVMPKPIPVGWPRGELLCETESRGRVYAYDPLKILKWCRNNKPEEMT
jgi:hypothetical protein